ncbi:GNAT family N-acetyltransferase [Lutibacter sp.]
MIQATHKDKKLVVAILTSAFASNTDGSTVNLIVGYGENRSKRMHILMAYLFERAMLFGEIFIADNKKGCLLIKYPHQEKITLKTIKLDMQLAFKSIGITNVYKVLKRQRIAAQNYPKENHIRPMIFGVKEDVKGGVTAARLMLHVKNHFKGNTLPVIIDAAAEYNVNLYQKFGFRIIKIEESLGFPMYFLRLN